MSAIASSSSSVIHSLLPPSVFREMESHEMREGTMCAVALLVTNVFLGTSKRGIAVGVIPALRNSNHKAFDANPGDAACQNRALILRELSTIDFHTECDELSVVANNIKRAIQERKGSHRRPSDPPDRFFQTLFASFEVSRDMEFLMHCHLLTVLRIPCNVTSEGIVETKTDISRLESLCSDMARVDFAIRSELVEQSQHRLSFMTAERIRDSLERSFLMPSREKMIAKRALSDKYTHVFTVDKRFLPKAFSCQFFAVKTVLARFKEQRALMALKGFLKKGEAPFYLFMQSPKVGEEFAIRSFEDVNTLSKTTPVVVFDSVIRGGREDLITSLEVTPFSQQVLQQAASVPPYESTSTAEDITDAEALEEVLAMKAKEASMPSSFRLDHIFLTTLEHELGGKK